MFPDFLALRLLVCDSGTGILYLSSLASVGKPCIIIISQGREDSQQHTQCLVSNWRVINIC